MSNAFAKRLVAARDQRGMTASDLARLLDVTPTAVWNWEKNGVTPRPEMLGRIARVLGVSAQQLLTGVAEDAAAVTNRTVTEVIDQARREIAAINGLPFDKVRIKVEFGSD